MAETELSLTRKPETVESPTLQLADSRWSFSLVEWLEPARTITMPSSSGSSVASGQDLSVFGLKIQLESKLQVELFQHDSKEPQLVPLPHGG